jgi:hypothetical protein
MATNNPFFISEMNTSITNPIRDDLDFPHSGLFKAFGQMAKGSYPIKASETDFDITLADGGTFSTIAVAAGKVFRHGKLITVSALSAVTMNTAYDDGSTSSSSDLTPHATLDVYLLIVVDGSGAIKIRGDSDSSGNNYSGGKIPKLMDWAGTAQPDDVIVAVVKLPAGIADDAYASIQVQYITTSQDDNSLSIGYASSNLYVEAMDITSDTSGDVTIENKVQDKDIIFKVNDGGASTEVLRIDGSDARVGIGGADTTPDAMLHLKSSVSSQPEIRLENTTSDSQEACIRFSKKAGSGGSGAVADGDDLGLIRFEGNDDAGNNTLFSYISADVLDASNGDEAGRVNHYIMQNGSNSIYLQLAGYGGNNATGHVTVNPSGGDVDFIAESDNQANMFKVDAGTDRVGILQGTPLSTLDINGSVSNLLTVSSATGGTPDLTLGEHSHVMFTQAGTAAVNMPAVATGRTYYLANIGAAPVTLTRAGSDTFTIPGSTPTTFDINPPEWAVFVGSGSTWYLMAKGALA